MPVRTYNRPREFFGISSEPLPGSENPMISGTQEDRFRSAGLQSFLPYVDPFQTVARSRQYRDMERDIQFQDDLDDAEMGFMEAVRNDPKTGYQKFLQQNPMATMSPMVRAYVSTQERFNPTRSGKTREQEVAELGSPYLKTYREGVKAGKDEIEAFADAVSQREKDLQTLKSKPSESLRTKFVEKGGDLSEFDSLAQRFGDDWAPYQDYLNKQPKKKTPLGASERNRFNEALTAYNDALAGVDATASEEAKAEAFKLAKGREPQSAQDWQDAYFMVKESTLKEPRGQLAQLVDLYEDRQIPEAVNRVLGTGDRSTPAPSPSPAATPAIAPQMPQDGRFIPPLLQRLETAPVAPPQAAVPKREFTFPTLGDDLPPTGLESAVQGVQTGVRNLASNIAFDPVQSALTAASPGGVTSMVLKAAPTNHEQEKAWTDAKQTVRDYLAKLPGDEAQKLKMLGSLVAEQDVPNDAYFPTKVGASTRVHAGKALEQGLKLFSGKKLGDTALKDAEGERNWSDVAKVVAQEELSKRGLIKGPEGSPTPSSVVQVTTRAQYDALPSGTPYTDSQGRRAVKK